MGFFFRFLVFKGLFGSFGNGNNSGLVFHCAGAFLGTPGFAQSFPSV
jgi:hypothetical protein